MLVGFFLFVLFLFGFVYLFWWQLSKKYFKKVSFGLWFLKFHSTVGCICSLGFWGKTESHSSRNTGCLTSWWPERRSNRVRGTVKCSTNTGPPWPTSPICDLTPKVTDLHKTVLPAGDQDFSQRMYVCVCWRFGGTFNTQIKGKAPYLRFNDIITSRIMSNIILCDLFLLLCSSHENIKNW